MAHVTKIALLTDKLIAGLTGFSTENDRSNFNAHHESALRILRSSSYARTDPFDVQHQFDGLEEKFRVYNKDDLADALRQRLDELAKRPRKWTPEILHLLIELSDKPIVNSQLDSLDFLEPTVEVAEPQYKWEDLAAEDPLLRDEHVWRNINYDSESSDDEDLSIASDMDASAITENTATSSIANEKMPRYADNLSVPVELTSLSGLETAQFWRGCHDAKGANLTKVDHERGVVFITELQAIREVLFMLSGLPTSLFIDCQQDARPISATNGLSPSKTSSDTAKKDVANNHITPAPKYRLRHVSPQVLCSMITKFGQYGSSILVLRVWVRSKQSVPLLQSVQSEVMRRIRRFEDMISNMQAGYVEPHQNRITSLVELQSRLNLMIRPLLEVSKIIDALTSEPYSHAFRFLELLYDRTCASQIIGDEELYEFLGTLFFDCFKVYLRQIRRWMEEGELLKNDNVFFISQTPGDLGLASLWSGRYKLRKTSSGALHAPRFLHPAMSKIFTTGKSVIVLKTLRKYDKNCLQSPVEEPPLAFQEVCGSPARSLAPFSEAFELAFDQWVKSKHHVTSSTLRKCLFDDCRLRDSLAALENIYFMANGAAASQFTDMLFEKLDSGKRYWNDRFTLTELAQVTIGCLPYVAAEMLKATVSVTNNTNVQASRKSVKNLSTFAFTYSLPWPVQIIVAKESIPSYQRIFGFLLQIRRATYVLQGIRLVPTKSGISEKTLFYGVRSRLLWFTWTLYSYLTDLVIDPNTKQMREALGEADDVDQMIDIHRDYMKKLTDQTLLGSKLAPIHQTVISILDLSIQLMGAHTREMTARSGNDGLLASIHDISLRQPRRADARVRQQELGLGRHADSSEEDGIDSETDPNAAWTTDLDLSYTDRMRKIRSQFDGLCNFVTTGLRGVARAGGEPNWDVLADKLESGLRVAA